jgi:hypothetical protein
MKMNNQSQPSFTQYPSAGPTKALVLKLTLRSGTRQTVGDRDGNLADVEQAVDAFFFRFLVVY